MGRLVAMHQGLAPIWEEHINQTREALAEVLSALGASNPTTKDMILELCVTEVCTMQSIWHLFWTKLSVNFFVLLHCNS